MPRSSPTQWLREKEQGDLVTEINEHLDSMTRNRNHRQKRTTKRMQQAPRAMETSLAPLSQYTQNQNPHSTPMPRPSHTQGLGKEEQGDLNKK